MKQSAGVVGRGNEGARGKGGVAHSPSPPLSAIYLAASIALLLTHLALGLAQLTATSPTFDEAFYIARGWAWWRTGRLLTLGHPALASQLAGAGALLEPGLPEPQSLAGWSSGEAEAFSEDLLWRRGANAARIVFLGRFPFLLASLALGALTGLWARRLFGPPAGVLALTLHALSPNLLANAPLAATDLLVAAFIAATWFAFLRAMKTRSRRALILAGVMLGLAQASKFSALFLAAPMGLWMFWDALRNRSLRALRSGAIIAAVGLATLWATYAFEIEPFPLASYFDDLGHILTVAGGGHWAYLLGRLSPTGWWYYHPFVLLVKTPLPVWLLLFVAGVTTWRRRERVPAAALLIPAAIFLLITMVQQLNVGYRYLLPIVPLLHVYAGGAARVGTGRSRLRFAGASIVGLWLAWGLGQVYPNYLAFFNEIAGGPRNGWRVLADSNLDWGQSLPALADELADSNAAPVFLSYFGQADPHYYGIDYSPLPGWPPPSPEPDFAPLQPVPGLYAISTSNLVGVQLYEPNALAWFRDREPDIVIDHTFFLYEVPTRAPGEWFYQCAAPVALLDNAQIAELTGQAALAGASFDCKSALLVGEGAGWVLAPGEATTPVTPGAPDYIWRRADGSIYYRTYYFPNDWEPDIPIAAGRTFGAALTFLGAQVEAAATGSESITVTAVWRVERSVPPPVSIYAHLIAPDGTLIAAGDALGAAPEVWLRGDRLIQQHVLEAPAADPGVYEIWLGLYRLDTGERYLTEAGEDGVRAATVTLSK